MLRRESTRQRNFSVGARVDVIGYRAKGIVRYYGKHKTDPKKGMVYAVELDRPIGKNNGTVKGEKYFECVDLHGVLVAKKKVQNPGTVKHKPKPTPTPDDMAEANLGDTVDDFDGDDFDDAGFDDDGFGNDFEDGAPAIGEDRDAPTDGDPPDNPGGDGDMEILDDDDFGGFDE